MKHTRPPTEKDLGLLAVIREQPQRVALAPVFFNGEPRLGLVLVVEKDGTTFMQILAILLEDSDDVLNGQGRTPVLAPTSPRSLH